MNVVISVNTAAAQAGLRGFLDRFEQNLLLVVTRLSIELQRYVKESKLTGQVLHVRTGTLRRSINRQVEQTKDGVSASVGTNVVYAGIHEFGGRTNPHIIEAKNKFSLKFQAGGKWVFRRRVQHPGSRIPERSFLRSALRDLTPRIQDSIAASARNTGWNVR